MPIVGSLRAVGEALGRSERIVNEWTRYDWWPYPAKTGARRTYDTELIKKLAMGHGLFDRAGADRKGVLGSETNEVDSKTKSAQAEQVSLANRIAQLKLTTTKQAAMLLKLRQSLRELVPAVLVHDLLAMIASRLRGFSVKLQQAGHTGLARVFEADLKAIEQAIDEQLARIEVDDDKLGSVAAAMESLSKPEGLPMKKPVVEPVAKSAKKSVKKVVKKK